MVGYSDRLSVAPGETIAFMVSSAHPTYRADIVRLIHGDPNPLGPGFIEEVVASPVSGAYPAASQIDRHRLISLGREITVLATHRKLHHPGLDPADHT